MKLTSFNSVLFIFVLVSCAWSITSAADLKSSSSSSIKSPSITDSSSSNANQLTNSNDEKSLFLANGSGKIIGTTSLSPNDTLVCFVLPRKTVEAISEEQKKEKASEIITKANSTLLAKSVTQTSNLIDSKNQSTTKITSPFPIENKNLVENVQSLSLTEKTHCALPPTATQVAKIDLAIANGITDDTRSSNTTPVASLATFQNGAQVQDKVVNLSVTDQTGTCSTQIASNSANPPPSKIITKSNNIIDNNLIAKDQNDSGVQNLRTAEAAGSNQITTLDNSSAPSSSSLSSTQKYSAEDQNKAAASTSENSSDVSNGINKLVDI